MKVFYSCLLVIVAVILLSLPITEGVHTFRTDVREETFNISTGVGTTTGSAVLHTTISDNDTSSIAVSSNISESPTWTAWNDTTKTLSLATLTANTSRQITVSYDADALGDNTAVNTLLDKTPLIWYLMIIALPACAIAAIFIRR